MAKYDLRFKKSVVKDLRSLPVRDLKRLLSGIEALADKTKPIGAVKLANHELYRIRVGKYRVVYEVLDTQLVVCVIRVAHRSTVHTQL